jgi:hypothetical protein
MNQPLNRVEIGVDVDEPWDMPGRSLAPLTVAPPGRPRASPISLPSPLHESPPPELSPPSLRRRAPAREGQSLPSPHPSAGSPRPKPWTGHRRPDREAQRGFGFDLVRTRDRVPGAFPHGGPRVPYAARGDPDRLLIEGFKSYIN